MRVFRIAFEEAEEKNAFRPCPPMALISLATPLPFSKTRGLREWTNFLGEPADAFLVQTTIIEKQ